MTAPCNEDEVLDLIDELWDRFDSEKWLTELAGRADGSAAKYLRQIAEGIIRADLSQVPILAKLRAGDF